MTRPTPYPGNKHWSTLAGVERSEGKHAKSRLRHYGQQTGGGCFGKPKDKAPKSGPMAPYRIYYRDDTWSTISRSPAAVRKYINQFKEHHGLERDPLVQDALGRTVVVTTKAIRLHALPV